MLIQADARQIPLRDGCVQCVVTSPPYFGLRDYGIAQQIGLEPTPDAYVAAIVGVFREVRRVLADDGCVWLNLGDSYAGGNTGNQTNTGQSYGRDGNGHTFRKDQIPGVKPKDLLGIPWRVAFALQQPYYTGSIKDERDRTWLAAMLDAEGCMFIQKRKAGQHNGQGYYRQNDNYGPGVEISNTSLALVERIMALVGKGSICSQGPDENARRKQTIYRWNLRTTESREFVRELYPYLVAKQQQARILCGCPSSGERAEAAHAGLIALHRTGQSDADFKAPESMFTQGWYLRSDVIWSKCNPMPESVTDRPTKSHEYLFLLSKQASYYYDADAIRESFTYGDPRPMGNRDAVARGVAKLTGNMDPSRKLSTLNEAGRNKRSVWTIPTMPYAGAHFATMPEALVEPCILAGSRLGDLILDPFSGSGTVLAVAERTGRRSVGIDLNPAYHALAKARTAQRGLRFEQESA